MKSVFKFYRLAWDVAIFSMGVSTACGFLLHVPRFYGLASSIALALVVFDRFAQRQFEAENEEEGK